MQNLTWPQVHAWRLAQQGLLRTSEVPQPVIGRICGLQAQVLSSAELALWARCPALEQGWIATALWERRSLVKTWAMRGTLHILPAADLPLYVAARSSETIRRPPSYYTYHGVTPEEFAAIDAGVKAVLSDTGMTREQLADAIAAQSGSDKLREVLRSGWGSLLKPSAYQGDLCFGPPDGQLVTFVRPDRWFGSWEALDPQRSQQEVARRYLRAYGPATPEEFARWWGMSPAPAKRIFRALGDELAEVEAEGWVGWALAEAVSEIQQAQPVPAVNLLPGFDPYTIALYRQPAVLDEEHRSHVSRPQGWISPVILVGGRMVGVWSYERKRSTTEVQLRPFSALSPEIQQAIEDEAARLGRFLGSDVKLAYV